jgi:hypothetical protein
MKSDITQFIPFINVGFFILSVFAPIFANYVWIYLLGIKRRIVILYFNLVTSVLFVSVNLYFLAADTFTEPVRDVRYFMIAVVKFLVVTISYLIGVIYWPQILLYHSRRKRVWSGRRG